jgi:hypothetical protein
MIRSIAKIFLVAVFIVTISSCERNGCKNVTCPVVVNTANQPVPQQCIQGKCVCEDGYEGATCDTASYLKYAGNYTGYENCSISGVPNNFSIYYPYIASAGSNYPINYIAIYNFLGVGTVIAQIQNNAANTGASIYIPSQSPGGGIIISDSYGNYSTQLQTGNIEILINLNYSYANSGIYQCQETLYKQ